MRVTPVLLAVAQHVNQRMARRAGRRQSATVPTISPELTPSKGQAIDSLCDADLKPAHARDEGSGVVGFHDEMHVVVLHGKMNDAKRPAAPREGLCDSPPNSGKNELTAQRSK
jgi:hypothetical protein